MVWLNRRIQPALRLRWRLVWGACLLAAVAGLACQQSPDRKTSVFREAETHFRSGEYDDALDDYRAFLESYPRHRLAETARLRIRSLNREVQSIMGRDDMQAPRYLAGDDGEQSADSPDRGVRRDAGDGA